MDAEPYLCHQHTIFASRVLLPTGHHAHVHSASLSKSGRCSVRKPHRDHQSHAIRRDDRAAVAQHAPRLCVLL